MSHVIIDGYGESHLVSEDGDIVLVTFILTNGKNLVLKIGDNFNSSYLGEESPIKRMDVLLTDIGRTIGVLFVNLEDGTEVTLHGTFIRLVKKPYEKE